MTVITLKSAQHLFCSRSNWLISTTLNWLMAWKFSFRNSNSDIAFITVAGKNNKNVFWLNIYLANKQKWHKGLKFFLQENEIRGQGQQGVKPYLSRNILGLKFCSTSSLFKNILLCFPVLKNWKKFFSQKSSIASQKPLSAWWPEKVLIKVRVF